MTSEISTRKLNSAAIPDEAFDQLSSEEKRAWLQRYLAEGQHQISSSQSTTLSSDNDIEALFKAIRDEAHERAGSIRSRKK